MSYPVGEVARLAGVTVRTLHHYDEIGLLRPRGRTAAGYRRYHHDDLARLQRILAYRELGFGLDEVAALLDGAGPDAVARLRRQAELLGARIDHLRRVMQTVDRTRKAYEMGIELTPQELLEVFGDHDPTQYTEEVEQRWGDTDAYRQSRQRTSRYGRREWEQAKADQEAAAARLAAAMAAGEPADGPQAMDAAEQHRQAISRWFYDCGPEMHVGLAQLYLADPRFTTTYEDRAPGLAQYVHDAIVANAARAAG